MISFVLREESPTFSRQFTVMVYMKAVKAIYQRRVLRLLHYNIPFYYYTRIQRSKREHLHTICMNMKLINIPELAAFSISIDCYLNASTSNLSLRRF